MAKNVLVVTSDVPFVHGGHRVIAEQLVRAVAEYGHNVELIRTPSNRFGKTLEAYLATWLTDVGVTGYGDPIDHVISLRYPAYAVRHRHHTAWVIHRMREYYDLWDHLCAGLGRKARLKEAIRREIIHRLDQRLLQSHTERVFCISDTVRDRLDRWGDIEATTLHPPPPVRPYRTDGYEPFVFAISRLHRWKRLDLLVEAVARTERLEAVIAGDGPEKDALAELARNLGVADRVRFLGAIDDQELVDWYARAACIFFAPLNEDYGFVTVEAFMSRKPVITCRDSGGVLDLVEHGATGYVVAPEAGAIAAAIEPLVADPQLCERLGEAAHGVASKLTWPNTVRTLLGETT